MISNPTFRYPSNGNEIGFLTKYLLALIYCNIIHNSPNMEATEYSINGLKGKEHII